MPPFENGGGIKTGVYSGIHYFLLITAQNTDCVYSLELPRRFLRVLTVYVLSRNIKKYQNFYLKTFSVFFFFFVFVFFCGEIFNIFE